jgi:hypothetical protein
MPNTNTKQEPASDEPTQTPPAEPTPADVEEQDTSSKEEAKNEPVQADKADKKKAFFFKATKYPGLTLQVQKMVDNKATGQQEQQVDESARFTEYYDTWKGDVIRVGYLKTESPKIAKAARADENVEEIDEKEYTQAIEGDSKNKPLEKAPTIAV